jgi:hypothetical protein
MSNPQLKVKTGPINKKNFFEKFHFRNRKSRQVVMAILGVYLLGGGLLGFFLFNLNVPDQAEAGSNAAITTSIRFLEEKDYEIGDEVPLILTLQNTSITEPVNDVSLNLFSTRDSIRWEGASNQLFTTSETIEPEANALFRLPPLAAGERAEYLVDGTLRVKTTDYLAILGKMTYENEGGDQEVDTNRIYTSLDQNLALENQPLLLASAKTEYAPGEQVTLTLSKSSETFAPLDADTSGKIYVNRRNSDEVVATYDCIPGESGLCEFPINNLEPGNYSSIFISDEGQQYSEVYWFDVSGSAAADSLVPSSQASLNFPFNNASVNGVVPVYADRVLSKNEAPELDKPCVFEVLSAGNVVARTAASITEDRRCYATLRTTQLPTAGVYTVRLANSSLQRDISFAGNSASLGLTNQTPNSQRGQSVQIRAENILDSAGDPVNDVATTVYVYHRETGSVNQILSAAGERLTVQNGVFDTFVPGSYLENSGNYQIYIQLETGAISDFLSLSLVDSDLGFSTSGIIVDDYRQLLAGASINLRTTGVVDREGEQVNSGSCRAKVFTVSDSSDGIGADGQIVDGECRATVPLGELTSAGPALITFADTSGNSRLNQSKQVQIAPRGAASYGQLYMQFSPVRRGYSNKVLLGPVRDAYNNLTDVDGLVFTLYDDTGEVVREVRNVSATNGYAELVIPSNSFNSETVVMTLSNAAGEEILRQEEMVVEAESSIITPELPTTLSNADNISARVAGISPATGENEGVSCFVRYIKSPQEILEEEVEQQGEICEFNWNLNQYRDQSQAILQMEYDDTVFSSLVELQSAEPGNIFNIYPEVKVNSQNELEVKLLTSPIVDRYGLPVDSGEVTWQYNGKVETSPIRNGFAELTLLANQLENRDIQTNFDQRFLDLDLEVKASLTSISGTNNLSIYIGNYDIAAQKADFGVREGSSYVSTQYAQVFRFESESCNAFILTENLTTIAAQTHQQGGSCYVDVSGNPGNNTLFFEDNGYYLGSFDFVSSPDIQEVMWCNNEGEKCLTQQVLAPISSAVEAILYDGENQYRFQGADLENTVDISQNGLNPLKEYVVEVKYTDLDGQVVSHFQTVQGEQLSP